MPDGGAAPVKTFTPGPDTTRDFRQALGQFATGVTVVTCYHDHAPLGITANSFSSVSLDPPLVLWSPARDSRRFAPFAEAKHFAIHVMSAGQYGVCAGFAKDGSAFDDLDWIESEFGVPLLNGCLARFECAHHAMHDGGDHAIIVGQVHRATLDTGDPLLFSAGRYGRFTATG